MRHFLKNIRLAENEHGQLARDVIYAELHDETGVVISATLEYILTAIRNRNIEVEGVEVVRFHSRGAMCSEVRLRDIV